MGGPTTLVDSCVLLDVLTDDKNWSQWSADRLAEAVDFGRVVINPIVYAEVSVGYDTVELLDSLLPTEDFVREALPFRAGFLAGKAYQRYRRNDGTKRSPMPDFYIGAHAAVSGYRLLTRDEQCFKSYFPTIDLIVPGP
ncbi:MAG: type II toxin-antitoxin system VapC family toxin [Nocardia sp.]|nr:type II toxin-antitoxin system VapC family toxin [Nocardia sp.]